MKPFVGYEEAITDLYNEFNVTDWRKSVHWLIKLGKIIDGRYKPKLHSTIIGLYHEIQESHKQLIQKTYKDQHYVLADEVSEWDVLQDIITTNGMGDATHLFARQKAYNDTVHDDLFYDRQYTLPDQVMRLLNDQGGDIKDYTECYGNQLQ